MRIRDSDLEQFQFWGVLLRANGLGQGKKVAGDEAASTLSQYPQWLCK
jgi:hypothetical protein